MSNRINKVMNITLPPKVREALIAYTEATQEKPSQLITRLVRENLTERGYFEETPPVYKTKPEGKIITPSEHNAGGANNPPTSYRKARAQ
jgi:hypothetical protein